MKLKVIVNPSPKPAKSIMWGNENFLIALYNFMCGIKIVEDRYQFVDSIKTWLLRFLVCRR